MLVKYIRDKDEISILNNKRKNKAHSELLCKKKNNNEADPTESGIPYFFQFPFTEMII